MKPSLSLLIPVHNEDELLPQAVPKIIYYLNSLDNISNYELIISDNGSEDNTKEVMKKLLKKYKKLNFISISERSAGLGLLNGIKKAKMDYIMYYSIDLPFGLDIIRSSVDNLSESSQIIIGSKYHQDSVIKIPLKRFLLSRLYYFLTVILFNFKIKDSQGSFLFPAKETKEISKFLDSKSFFILTQIILYLGLLGKNPKEIPIKYTHYRKDSKMKLVNDSFVMLKEMLAEYKKYRRIKRQFKR